jgi:hypothetical protein
MMKQMEARTALKLEQEKIMKSMEKRGLTEVMVLFLARDAARACPPSEPRRLKEASSYAHGRNEGRSEK